MIWQLAYPFALLLFVLIRSARTYRHWLEPFCRYGARSTYSLYVVHFPLVVLLAALFVTPGHRLPPPGGTLLSFVGSDSLRSSFVAIIYSYGVSALSEANRQTMARISVTQGAASIMG